jgi:hypothetical protein
MYDEIFRRAASLRAMEEYDCSHSDAEREDMAPLDRPYRLPKARQLTRSDATNEQERP